MEDGWCTRMLHYHVLRGCTNKIAKINISTCSSNWNLSNHISFEYNLLFFLNYQLFIIKKTTQQFIYVLTQSTTPSFTNFFLPTHYQLFIIKKTTQQFIYVPTQSTTNISAAKKYWKNYTYLVIFVIIPKSK